MQAVANFAVYATTWGASRRLTAEECCRFRNPEPLGPAECWLAGFDFDGCPAGVHVLSFGYMDPTLACTALSVNAAGGLPRVLGLQDNGFADRPPALDAVAMRTVLAHKIWRTKQALASIPPDDIVLYIDATDTIVMRPLELLRREYEDVVRDLPRFSLANEFLEPVIVSATPGCFPNGLMDKRQRLIYRAFGAAIPASELCARVEAFAAERGEAPWLDPGVWVGRADAARVALDLVYATMVADFESHDQPAWNLVRLHFPGLLVPDSQQRLFFATETHRWPDSIRRLAQPRQRARQVQNVTERFSPPLCKRGFFDSDARLHGPPPWEGDKPVRRQDRHRLGRETRPGPFVIHFSGHLKYHLLSQCCTALIIAKGSHLMPDLPEPVASMVKDSEMYGLATIIDSDAETSRYRRLVAVPKLSFVLEAFQIRHGSLLIGEHDRNFTAGFDALTANLMHGEAGDVLFSSEDAVPLLTDLPENSLIDLWQYTYQLQYLELEKGRTKSFGHERIA